MEKRRFGKVAFSFGSTTGFVVVECAAAFYPPFHKKLEAWGNQGIVGTGGDPRKIFVATTKWLHSQISKPC